MPSNERIRGWLFVLSLAFFIPAPAMALDIRDLEITHEGDRYRVHFDVVVPVLSARAQALLGDYHQWPNLSDTMTESRLLQTYPDGRQRVRVVFHSCVLLFCKDVSQTKELDNRQDGEIRAVVVPAQSDFRYGWEHWQIRPAKDLTRIQYRAEFVPAFALPPVIGPWILKTKLRQQLILTVERLELLAGKEIEPASHRDLPIRGRLEDVRS
ncbi:MAG: hypothetical protein R3268_13500 [Acidiferrobacterales bacterium]|nr:hypothetical protein [Acidiferrobacterales bacterium]